MNDLLVSLGLSIVILTIPVMLAARYLKAEKPGFTSALRAVVLMLATFYIASYVIPTQSLAILASVAVGTLAACMVLDTTLMKGFIINICFVALAAMIKDSGIELFKMTSDIVN